MNKTVRTVATIIPSTRTLEGAGFEVRRPFPTSRLDHFDPFLLLDEMGPKNMRPGEARGAPDHPHRGFETVTYLLSGSFEHRDSQGNHGSLVSGDVQWMTAGAGVIHSEMPSAEMMAGGGKMHGFQLWVNLPARDKMMKPRYQDVPAENIPLGVSPDKKIEVRVIAGESLGARAVIDTRTPITYLHVRMEPGSVLEQNIPAEQNAFAYVFGGSGRFSRTRVGNDGDMVVFETNGDRVLVENPETGTQPLEFLLLAGQPLNEPVARSGPFVMNTRQEVFQAYADYQSGQFGKI
jgi:quercetin 2,3-dioxygenase